MRSLFVALSLSLLILTVFIGWDEYNREWKPYQRAYYALVEQRAASDAEREWAISQRLHIEQIEVEALGRVDRCPTCHPGTGNPNMAGAGEPFRFHASLLDSHPPERFGCTLCHGGQGRAVTVLAGHGQVPDWPARLRPGEYIQAACYACHGLDTLPPAPTSAVAQGIKLFNQYRCLHCHQIRGRGGVEGPDLSTVGSRRDWVRIYAHLLNPQAMSPGSTMPDYALSRDQARYLTIYLMTLLDDAEQVTDVRLLPRRPATATVDGETSEVSETSEVWPLPQPRYDGRELFTGLGCRDCHRIGRQGGEVAAALTHIGRVRDADWLRRLLRDPAQVIPEGAMPAMHLTERQVEALTEYLTTLK